MLKKTFLYFRLRPIYYHSLTPYLIQNLSLLTPWMNYGTPEQYMCEINIMDLKRKIGQLTSEVEGLQSHLVKNPWQVFLWSFIFDQQIYEGQDN